MNQTRKNHDAVAALVPKYRVVAYVSLSPKVALEWETVCVTNNIHVARYQYNVIAELKVPCAVYKGNQNIADNGIAVAGFATEVTA